MQQVEQAPTGKGLGEALVMAQGVRGWKFKAHLQIDASKRLKVSLIVFSIIRSFLVRGISLVGPVSHAWLRNPLGQRDGEVRTEQWSASMRHYRQP